MKFTVCKCGHGINIHNGINGCQHSSDDGEDLCKCMDSPQDILWHELAEVVAAGDNMAEQLWRIKQLREGLERRGEDKVELFTYIIFGEADATALAAWKQIQGKRVHTGDIHRKEQE